MNPQLWLRRRFVRCLRTSTWTLLYTVLNYTLFFVSWKLAFNRVSFSCWIVNKRCLFFEIFNRIWARSATNTTMRSRSIRRCSRFTSSDQRQVILILAFLVAFALFVKVELKLRTFLFLKNNSFVRFSTSIFYYDNIPGMSNAIKMN